MRSTAKLFVAIYEERVGYKHWSLFFEGPTEAEKWIFHLMGSATRFRVKIRLSDAGKSQTLHELVHLCEVDTSKLDSIKAAARGLPIHNEELRYNCQDYVFELVENLERTGIITIETPGYEEMMIALKAKQDGY